MVLALLIQRPIDLQPPWRSIAQRTVMHCMPQEHLGTHEQVYACGNTS
jgi:hypothetical protein